MTRKEDGRLQERRGDGGEAGKKEKGERSKE